MADTMKSEGYPVLEILHELKERLASTPIVILEAPPGAGKSTILPLQLRKEPWLNNRKIVMLEPRRLAAKAVAERMADLSNQAVGGVIGYRIRFDTKVSSQTEIEVVTEGILTRMIQSDNSLEDAGLLIFDEFHERSLHADLALALCLQVQSILRPDLKILIMSATLDTESLSRQLNNAPVIRSQGRQFPVSIKYSEQESDMSIVNKVAHAIRKALRDDEGDMLVFLPGAPEIKRVHQLLEEEEHDCIVYPLYGDLNYKKQQEAILPDPRGKRKVVLATSIAETSLTIEGIKIVIDSGLSRVPRFDPRSGLTRLDTIKVTRDAADQRAGRAGRLGPGICYRLWTSRSHMSLQEQRKPEVLEADLAPLMLELLAWGVRSVNELNWISTPPLGAANQALDLLKNLDALDEKGITSKGREMLSLPTHPRIAHMLLEAKESAVTSDLCLATDLAALVDERDPLARDEGADATLRIDALRKWRKKEVVNADKNVLERIERVAANWRRIMRVQEDNSRVDEGLTGRLLFAAYPERLAQQQGKHSPRYKLLNGRTVSLQQHDPLVREPLICASHLDAGTSEGKIFMAAPVHLVDLRHLAKEQVIVKWDKDREMIVSVCETRIGLLLVESKPVLGKISQGDRQRILCEQVRIQGIDIIGNAESRLAFQARVQSLHHWRKEEMWPSLTDEYLLQNVEQWLGPFITDATKLSDLKRLDIVEILRSSLPWELHSKLESLAPEKISVPSGSLIRLQYMSNGEPPVLEVRLQEMFGLASTPTVNDGRTKVRLHLLSPGYKPVQVTQDLKSFWETTYHEIRKELRIRYPKHHWPEDPWTAEAVRGVKRKSSG